MSIEVKNIYKKFGNFEALKHVSLEFPSGELVALLGPSGCGKTTLLRIIAGLETADAGQVLLHGEDASDTHVSDRQVGFVFQHYALFRHMTVFDNIAFGLRVKKKKARLTEKAIAAKVHELLNLVQLDFLQDRFPAQLSGGQRQRIALARALAVEPKVLLLDEPFGALDAKVRKELRRWLRKLHNELHITSIFVTHDQEEALEVADRIVLMNHGQVEQIGNPHQVYDNPATPFVYDFLGNVNLMRGQINHQQIQIDEHQLNLPEKTDLTNIEPTNGTRVLAFVRPHELEIHEFSTPKPQASAKNISPIGIPARIERILSFGASAKVELTTISAQQKSGLPQNSDLPQHFEAEVLRSELLAKGLSEGSQVRLIPSQIKLFKQP